MYISIIIPAYNEEKRILKTLESVVQFLAPKSYKYEVIVVDDGSSDLTAATVEEFAAKHPCIRFRKNDRNMGKGYSVKRGAIEASGDFVYFTDADMATPIAELENFFAAIQSSDIVIGSRAIEGARVMVHAPVYREVLGRIFCRLVKLFGMPGYTDTQCGAKMFRKDAAQKIFPLQKLCRFAFDVELLYLARQHGYTVQEIPVKWFHSADTRVRALPDGLTMLLDLIKIRFIHRT